MSNLEKVVAYSDPDHQVDDGAQTSVPPAAPPGDAWWTAERAAVCGWLERNAPELAPVYMAAVRMAMDETFPGRVWFVAHAIREMRNRLPDALAGEFAAHTDYARLAGSIYLRWIEDGLPGDGTHPVDPNSNPSASGPARRDMSSGLVNAVADLVAGHLAATGNNEAKARRLFEFVGGAPPPPYVVKMWLRGTKWANAYAHVRNEPLPMKDEEALAGNFLAFEQALMAISNRSYENMDALDEILGAANR